MTPHARAGAPAARAAWFAERTPGVQTTLLSLVWGRRTGREPTVRRRTQRTWWYILLQEGSATLDLPGGAEHLSAGDVLVAALRGGLAWQSKTGAANRFLAWEWSTPPSLPEILPADVFTRRCRLDREGLRRLEQIHARCRHEVIRQDAYSSKALEALRLQMDVELARAQAGSPSQDRPAPRTELAVRWMQEHLDLASPISLLCDCLGVSPSTLKREFTKGFGQTPWSYYQGLRMERAREWLREGRRQVKEIAYELGYRHANDFSRAYKAFFGTSPRQAGKEGGT